jgi:hypothetical protein
MSFALHEGEERLVSSIPRLVVLTPSPARQGFQSFSPLGAEFTALLSTSLILDPLRLDGRPLRRVRKGLDSDPPAPRRREALRSFPPTSQYGHSTSSRVEPPDERSARRRDGQSCTRFVARKPTGRVGRRLQCGFAEAARAPRVPRTLEAPRIPRPTGRRGDPMSSRVGPLVERPALRQVGRARAPFAGQQATDRDETQRSMSLDADPGRVTFPHTGPGDVFLAGRADRTRHGVA